MPILLSLLLQKKDATISAGMYNDDRHQYRLDSPFSCQPSFYDSLLRIMFTFALVDHTFGSVHDARVFSAANCPKP